MLIEFRVENFRSLHHEQTLSMVASGVDRHRDTHVREGVADGFDVLNTALVYGANASGKTNVVAALDVLKQLVTPTVLRNYPGDPLGALDPFRLDPLARSAPTTFEVIFVEKGVRYRYGTVISRERVEEEWLYSYPVRERLLFQRFGDDVEFGPTLRTGPAKSVRQLVPNRPRSLFLSLLAEFQIDEIAPVAGWFIGRLNVLIAAGFPDTYTRKLMHEDRGARQFVSDIIRYANTGIDLVTVKRVIETVDVPETVARIMREMGQPAPPPEFEHVSVTFERADGEGEAVQFEEDDESMGTMRLFALAGPLYEVLRDGLVMVVDELDTSLHPDLMRVFVGLFHNPGMNPHGAQLIATTHDTSMLDREVIRPDNVWLTEKDRRGATTLYPLTDFPVRSDAAFASLYHAGRVGGLPALAFSLLDDIDDYAATE